MNVLLHFKVMPEWMQAYGLREFPESLRAGNEDVVRIGYCLNPGNGTPVTNQIAVSMEIKGTAGTQKVPLDLPPVTNAYDRRHVDQFVQWNTIGTLREIDVSVSRVGGGEPVTGSIEFAATFERLSWQQKLNTMRLARIAGVLLAALLAALVLKLLTWHKRPAFQPNRNHKLEAYATIKLHDFVLGVAVVSIAGLALGIDALSQQSELAIGWLPLALACGGAALAEWLKFGLTGKHLRPGELFQDLLITGLLAASASSLAILQKPDSWQDLLALSSVVAIATTVIYHAANAIRLATTGRHLGGVTGGLILGTPYVFGLLTLLEPPAGLLETLASGMPQWADFCGSGWSIRSRVCVQ